MSERNDNTIPAHLLAAARLGELTDEQAAQLNALLRDDPAARRQYAEHMLLHADLSWERTAQRLAGPRPVAPEPVRVAAKARMRLGPVAMSIAAALLLSAAAVAVYFAAGSGPTETDDPRPPVSPIATLIESTGTVVYEDDIARPGSDYAAGAYAIESGSAQLLLTSRVTVNLDGRTRLVMHNPMHASLSRGAASFHCPPGAEGFTVDLPGGARVVDLGTRFGIELGEAGEPEIRVTEGAVQVVAPGGLAVGVLPGMPLRIVDGRAFEWAQRLDVPIANASFEQPRLDGEPFSHGADGWEAIDNADQYGVNAFGADFADPVPDGDQLAFINQGAIAQTVDASLTPGVRYTLSVMVGNRPGPNSPDYALELWARGQRLASAVNPVAPPKGRFAPARLVFDCPADHPAIGQPIRIVLRSNGSLSTNTQNHFDDVRFSAELRAHRSPPPHPDDEPGRP